MSKIHIGRKIREVLDKSPLSVVDFAKKISITRDGAYKIFEKERINTALLQKISDVLEHDFFSYYSSPAQTAGENAGNYGYATKDELQQLTNTVTLLVKEIEKLRQELHSSPKASSKKRTAKQKNKK
jgi:hypothetical protein